MCFAARRLPLRTTLATQLYCYTIVLTCTASISITLPVRTRPYVIDNGIQMHPTFILTFPHTCLLLSHLPVYPTCVSHYPIMLTSTSVHVTPNTQPTEGRERRRVD